MKNGFDASAAKPPEIAPRPIDSRYFLSGEGSAATPLSRLAVEYEPKRTDTLENCHQQLGHSPRCSPRQPSLCPICRNASKTPEYGERPWPSWPCSCILVLMTSIGLVKQIAITADVPAHRNSPQIGRCSGSAAMVTSLSRVAVSVVTSLSRRALVPVGGKRRTLT
eukprot:scaffold38351_cov63-Phaeocystis_antarctica.AAC.13